MGGQLVLHFELRDHEVEARVFEILVGATLVTIMRRFHTRGRWSQTGTKDTKKEVAKHG